MPGGPCSRMPFGTVAPSRLNCFGRLRNSTTSRNSSLVSSTPSMSAQVTELADLGVICCGLVRGISFSVRQIR